MSENPIIQSVLTRRSVLVKNMCEPGPNPSEIELILQAAHRVPDHGKIGPWRFIVFSGQRRAEFGKTLQARYPAVFPEATDSLIEAEAERFLRAPLVIGVISSPIKHKVPVWEQELSAGAACQNILHASHALGFAAQWLTEWYACDEVIDEALGLGDKERFAGFIYIGSAAEKPSERNRPSLEDRVRYY